ncbi:hypothetical protein Dimus_007535 [Dionaea muscipula]
MKAGIHALTEKDQKAIIMNANFQPIGPDEKTVSDFVEFLGTLSRTSSLCPLTVDKWTDMNKVYKDAKEKMWDYVKKRWAIPNGAKKWVLQTIGVLWRNYKGKASTRNESSSINVPNELLESIKADVTAQVTAELTANMMQTVTSQVAQHLCSSVSFHLKQINPLIDIDPNCPHEISNYKTASSDASSAPNHQSSVGLNGDSSIGANKTHFEVLRGDNSALANDITNVSAVVFHTFGLNKLRPVIVHVNYHPDKLPRMQAVVEYYVNGKQHALDSFPDGSE